MNVGDLYQFVLLLVLVGMIIGVGVITLDKFAGTSSVGATAGGYINDTRDEIGGIATNWLGLIVTIAIMAIILTLVIRSFRGGGR